MLSSCSNGLAGAILSSFECWELESVWYKLVLSWHGVAGFLVSDEYLDYLRDLLDWVPGLRLKRMFGGLGLYSDNGFFAIVDRDTLYLKGDDLNRERYREGGAERFSYLRKGKPAGMDYWSVPADVLEDAERLEEWVRAAMDAALRGAR